jgi:D-hydroxyproline dehydrogenase subunit beta
VIDGGYMAAVASADAGLQVSTVMETTLDGHVLVGSSRERRGFDVSVDPAVSDALLRAAARLAPGVGGLRVESAWAGLRPWLPDDLPITGRLVAQAMCGEPTELGLEPFRPDRFSPG